MDEIFKSELSFEQDHIVHKLTQPTENLILERNSQLRKNEGVIQDLGAQSEEGTWGRQVASIPFVIWQKAIKNGYDLQNKDYKVSNKELFRFLQSEDGKKCLVRGRI